MDVYVKNTGIVDVSAILFASVNRNGEFIDLVRGNEYIVESNKEAILTQIFHYTEPGEYSAEVYVEYGKKKTSPLTVKFSIKKTSLLATSNSRNIIILLASICIFTGIGSYLFILFKRKHSHLKNKR
ncbi:MAG: hypothetical protein AAB664_00610 [Patescibacteria group bacterium]